jgi:hypothetical protein
MTLLPKISADLEEADWQEMGVVLALYGNREIWLNQ